MDRGADHRPAVRQRNPVRRWGWLLVILAMAAVGCGGAAPADPTDALVDAVERTFSGSYAFDVQLEMDEEARSSLPGGEMPVGALLDSLEVTGRTSGGDALQLTVAAMGQELFELRQTDATHLYLRTDAGQIAETFGFPLNRQELLSEAEQAPEAVREMWTGLLDGRWIGVVGEASGPAAGVLPGPDPSELRAAQEEAFGGSPGGFARRFAVATPAEAGDHDGRVFAVTLQTRAMAEAMFAAMSDVFGEEMAGDGARVEQELQRIPETVGGVTVGVSRRLVDRVTVDVYELARSMGADGSGSGPTGSLKLVAELSEHGTAGGINAPADALEVAAEDLGMYHPAGMLPGYGMGNGLLWPFFMGGMSMSSGAMDGSAELEVRSEVSELAPTPGPDLSDPGTVRAVGPTSFDLFPHSGPPGTEVTINVEGFEPGAAEIRWDGPDGPVLATTEGPDFTVRVTIPAAASVGQHQIVIEPSAPDARRSATISFEVTR